MTIPTIPLLQRIYASAPTDYYLTLAMRISNEGQDDICICHDYYDRVFVVDGVPLNFEAGQVNIKKPTISTKGSQPLSFGFAGVSRRALRFVENALESRKPIYVEIFEFINMPNGESEIGMRLRRIELVGGKITGDVCQFEASHHELLNWRFPRERYTPQTAPGIRYA